MTPHLEELACLYVLDRLDAPERTAFETDLLRDPALAAFTRELEAAFARRIHALPQHRPPADLLASIETRLDLSSGARSVPVRPATLPWASFARWGLAAIIAVSLGTIAVQLVRKNSAASQQPYVIVVGLDPHQSTQAQLSLPERARDADASFIQLASLAQNFWEKPGNLPVKQPAPNSDGRGYALFDPVSNQGFIAVQHLPVLATGKCYRLWILDARSGETRDAGVLPLAGTSRGLYFFSIAAATGTPAGRFGFFITTEDTATSDQPRPHGKVVLGSEEI